MENGDKGNFQADIPDEFVAEALRSVESHGTGESDEGGEIEIEAGEPGADTSRQRELEQRLADVEAQLREKEQQARDAQERLLRIAADLENLRKRTAREKEETVKYGNERLLKDLLPVVDNLERAVEAGATEGLLEGVQLVLKQFVDTLERHEVRSFSAKGQPFDPNLHEALMQEENGDVPPNTVVGELVKGYHLRDRLIRPAAVVVSRAPSNPAPAPEASPDSNAEPNTEPHTVSRPEDAESDPQGGGADPEN